MPIATEREPMAKRGPKPNPWYRKSTDSWYVTLDGNQVPLGREKETAYQEFYRLMASRGDAPAIASTITVRQLSEMWLCWCEHEGYSVRTLDNYRLHARTFTEMFGGLKA